jgi:hypothetical protein
METYLVFFKTVLEDILDNQATGLAKSNFVPHATECIVDILHDLRWRLSPTKFKELLPDMASITMNHRLRDAAEQLMNHDGLIVLWNRVKCLLNDVTSESVHGEVQGVTTN